MSAPTSSAAAAPIANTGTSNAPMAILAMLAILGGAALTFAARRRPLSRRR
jgi:LPXTG-motif cell wall-anchored protein